MSARNDKSWLFIVEWFDPMPRLKRQYLLKYFVQQHAVEMVDIKSKKLFLKKSPCPNEIRATDFFIGSKILLYSRELEIVEFGDGTTRSDLEYQMQSTLIILSPETYTSWGKIIDSIQSCTRTGMVITNMKTVVLSRNVAENVCAILNESIMKSASLSSGVSCVMIVQGEDGISAISSLVKSLNSSPETGGSILTCSDSQQVSKLNDLILQNRNVSNSSTLDNCTCCIIKPHAVKQRNFGRILDTIISQGYEVSAITTLNFDKVQAEEFLEVYKGVIPDYSDHVIQLCLGQSIALELRAEDAVPTFRQTAGPWDVEMAKTLRPGSLRALFGEDNVRSAIHCTDLPLDAVAECEYCFRILSN